MLSRKVFDESSVGTSWSSSEPFSSGLSTPFGSELGSTETESEDDEDFMAELTRQMANYMLEDDDDESRAPNCASQQPEHLKAGGGTYKWSGGNSTSTYYCDEIFMSTSSTETIATTKSNGVYHTQSSGEGEMQTIEVYQLENQPSIKRDNYLRAGRRVGMMSKSGKQPKVQELQHKVQDHRAKGAAMRAIFLGGSGSGAGSSGTGVFLPRIVHNQPEPKKRLGCSTVLIPTRVLQALESHFNNMDALSQSNGCGGFTYPSRRGDLSERKRNISHIQTRPASNSQEMQLPEDWTY